MTKIKMKKLNIPAIKTKTQLTDKEEKLLDRNTRDSVRDKWSLNLLHSLLNHEEENDRIQKSKK